jgi:hypothetical protein
MTDQTPEGLATEWAKARAHGNGDADARHLRTLLRMLDELRAETENWRDAVAGKGGWNDMVAELRAERNALRAKLAEAEYQLAEEKNANANDRDPSYHEQRLTQENAILKRALADALEGQ